MMVVAVQLCATDHRRAANLANMLVDVQPRRREDVVLLFATCDRDVLSFLPLAEAVHRCTGVFTVGVAVVDLRVPPGATRQIWGREWSLGFSPLWQGVVDHFLAMGPRWDTLFVVDGGNGVPLHRDWLDHVAADHARTIGAGQLVTGCVFRDDDNRSRLGGNLVFGRRVFELESGLLTKTPPFLKWGSHYDLLLRHHARASSLVRYDRNLVGLRQDSFAQVAETSAWWHGCRDVSFVDLARSHLGAAAGAPAPGSPVRGPTILDYGPVPDLLAGGDYRGEAL